MHPAEPVLSRSQGGAGGGALSGAPPQPVVPPRRAAEEEAGGRQFEREKSQRLVAPQHSGAGANVRLSAAAVCLFIFGTEDVALDRRIFFLYYTFLLGFF